MNYVLDNFYTSADVLDSNTTADELLKIFDNQYSSKCIIPVAQTELYIKVPFTSMQYFVFHNISASKVVVELYRNDNSHIETQEKTTLKSAGLTYCDVIYCRRLYYDYDLLMEFDKIDVPGYAKVYIHALDGAGFVGRVDWGIPEWLGYLEWDFKYGGKASTMPVIDPQKAITAEDRVIAWDTHFSCVLEHLRTKMNEPDQNATYTISKLKRLFVAHKEEIITGYDDTNTAVIKTDWVMKKTTFIEPTVTKSVGWFAIENYEAVGKNSVVTKIKLNLKGFKDGKD